MRFFIIFTVLIFTAVTAARAAGDVIPASIGERSMQLGQVMGNAEACGIAVNPDALTDYMDKLGMLNEVGAGNFETGRRISGYKKPSTLTCATTRATVAKIGLGQ